MADPVPYVTGPPQLPAGYAQSGTSGSLVDVSMFMTPIVRTGFSTYTVHTSSLFNGLLESSAQNDEASWDVLLGAGTWTIELLHFNGTNRGIYTFSLDGTDVGTIDGYAGSFTANQRASITNIVVGSTGVKRLRVKMSTKNASSSGYQAGIHHLQLRRTA